MPKTPSADFPDSDASGRCAPRLAVRGVLVHRDRLLLVNAWRGEGSDLWCAPGGGVEPGQSLPDNLRREIHEETGLRVDIGRPCLINEFHEPASGFHQVEVFFRCSLIGEATIQADWADPEGVVSRWTWADREEATQLRIKPDSLRNVAWVRGFGYDPLERLVR